MPTMLHTWDRLADLHRWYAELDAPDPRPHLAAFAGDHACVLIGLRPFAPGAYQGPLVEAMALALPLGADRVSVALPGRAWSLDDPVVPVSDDGDLRQRVLTQCTVDGHRQVTPRVTMRLHPFDVGAAPRCATCCGTTRSTRDPARAGSPTPSRPSSRPATASRGWVTSTPSHDRLRAWTRSATRC